MVISIHNNRQRQRASLMVEMVVAIAILMIAIVPVAYSFDAEKRAARATYDHAIAMEIVDGEMEVLLAGEWRVFTPGTHPYPVKANALTNLPPGQFTFTLTTNKVRLEWKPSMTRRGGSVVREATLE
jgi:type II secretory pathway pseudopilin PulG